MALETLIGRDPLEVIWFSFPFKVGVLSVLNQVRCTLGSKTRYSRTSQGKWQLAVSR